MSEFDQIFDFTDGAIEAANILYGLGQKSVPATPQPISAEQAVWLARMMISEVVEFLQATGLSDEEINEVTKNAVNVDLNTEYTRPTNDIDIVAEQADALVDIMYYAGDCAWRNGIALQPIFAEVQAANMRKRNHPPGEGVYNGWKIRADGKVLKPEGWVGPDINKVIADQYKVGEYLEELKNCQDEDEIHQLSVRIKEEIGYLPLLYKKAQLKKWNQLHETFFVGQ